MATIQFKNGSDYLIRLSALEKGLRKEVIGAAIYGAAGIVADTVRQGIDALPTDNGYGSPGSPLRGPSRAQKEGLKASFGVTPMRDDGTGFVDVKIGFDGYNNIRTKRWPKGQPNQMVARSIERGTSWMQGNQFMKKAVSVSRKKALAFMREKIDDATEKIMKG